MIKLLKNLTTKDWIFAVMSVGLIVFQVWLDLKLPDYMGKVTSIAKGYGEMNDIWYNGGLMLLCALGSLAASIATGYFVARIAANFSTRIRDQVYSKVQNFSLAEINKFSNASLITRATNDIQQVQLLITMGLQMMIKAPITAIWAICKISNIESSWTLATIIAVVFLIVSMIVILLLVYKKFKKMQKLTDQLNQNTRENLAGIKVVRAYNAESYQEGKFEETNSEYTKTNLFSNRTLGVISPIISLVMNGLTLAIYWIGAYVISNAALAEVNELSISMTTFFMYGLQIIGAFMMLAMMFMIAPRALVSAKRINEVIDTKSSILDGEGVGKTDIKGTIEFKNVSFRYPDANADVVTDINFNVRQGETVAIIGSTGCGKTSIVNLVSRFYDATNGEVLVDGHNVKEYTKQELNKKIGYVSQKAVLFKGNIKDNIEFGDNVASIENLQNAIDISQCQEFVNKKDDKENSSVAQMGNNYSGGQKQRISIARAIARNAEIYIFDDTFSALDYKTDKKLRTSIKKQMNKATCLIVAQRIGTIKDADKIIVIEDGKIVGIGKHSELLSSCKTYIDIAKSQLSEEELKNEQ